MSHKWTYSISFEEIRGFMECRGYIKKEEGLYSFTMENCILHTASQNTILITDILFINEIEYRINQEMNIVSDYEHLDEIYKLNQ